MNALIVVDIQNDFLPGGALAVKNGDKIIQKVNLLLDHFDFVVATQDWHPANHKSFASNNPGHSPGDLIEIDGLDQVLWPNHCIQNTTGAQFSKNLNTGKINKVIQKGQNPLIDSYSGFFDNGKKQDTGLYNYLKENNIDEVFIVGLATDFCVKYTAQDAAELGLKTKVIADVTKAVNLREGDYENSLDEMKSKGVEIITSQKILT